MRCPDPLWSHRADLQSLCCAVWRVRALSLLPLPRLALRCLQKYSFIRQAQRPLNQRTTHWKDMSVRRRDTAGAK